MSASDSSGIIRVHLRDGGYVRGMADVGETAHEVITMALIRLEDPGDGHISYVPSDRILYVSEEVES